MADAAASHGARHACRPRQLGPRAGRRKRLRRACLDDRGSCWPGFAEVLGFVTI
ncbi:hypothetical protein GQ55_1G409800 [Panicum hallii var. hallii]|uniref:Uncharacterized protein n=1 Tax=Panicum hallii var. hallii TaxID=1504633 RepID=A0A2T7FCX5_9POAL|nr:hypothetical protein GQ55_1G409800 [Panicum hallii var. hallii]